MSGCLETPKGKLPSINQAEIDMEAERQKRLSYAKYIDQMSLVKSIGFKINSLNADICNKTDFNSGLTFSNENVMGLKIAKFFPSKINLGSQVSIISIVKNSPADKAGLALGDIILEVEGYTFPEGKNALKKISKHFKDIEEKKIKKIKIDRNGEIIYSHEEYLQSKNISSLSAFPWLDTLEMETKRPYALLKPINNKEKVIDERVAYLITNILQEHMKRGSAGRTSASLNRDDIAGKTGTTNDAISTWFSGFHQDLATTVWVGTDNFSSLGKNEYGSSIALPIWVDYMNDQLQELEVKTNSIPENMSFIKVNPDTGKPNISNDANAYFELFLDENITN